MQMRCFLAAIFLIGWGWCSMSAAADHTADPLTKIRELVEAKKAVLIDVREQVEWDAGHIEGAKLVPLSKLKTRLSEAEMQKLFPADKIIYLYCAGGYRCLDVAEMFENGPWDLRALKYGYVNLVQAGFPKSRPSDASPVPAKP